MIWVAEGGRQAMNILGDISIIPPGKGIGPGHLEKAEYGQKGRYTDNQIDKLPELGSCAG